MFSFSFVVTLCLKVLKVLIVFSYILVAKFTSLNISFTILEHKAETIRSQMPVAHLYIHAESLNTNCIPVVITHRLSNHNRWTVTRERQGKGKWTWQAKQVVWNLLVFNGPQRPFYFNNALQRKYPQSLKNNAISCSVWLKAVHSNFPFSLLPVFKLHFREIGSRKATMKQKLRDFLKYINSSPCLDFGEHLLENKNILLLRNYWYKL